MAARLRQEGSTLARQLADWIDAQLSSLPSRVAADLEIVTPRSPFDMVGSHMVRVTPSLLQTLKEMELRLQLCQEISVQLTANPDWIEFEKMLW